MFFFVEVLFSLWPFVLVWRREVRVDLLGGFIGLLLDCLLACLIRGEEWLDEALLGYVSGLSLCISAPPNDFGYVLGIYCLVQYRAVSDA